MKKRYPLPLIIKNSKYFGALYKIVNALYVSDEDINLYRLHQDKNIFDENMHVKSDIRYPRLVGGIVRDMLLDKLANDVDICTVFHPDNIIAKLQKINAHTIPTGISHGTITAILENHQFEITTLRIDDKCDGRHASVSFTNNFYIDAQRRDFTINAMSYCVVTENLYDYFDGTTHLKNKKVIFIGDNNKRIEEDALRILRFFRFSAYYANQLDSKGYESAINNKSMILQLSKERIVSELNKIIISDKSIYILDVMKPMFEELKITEFNIESLKGVLQINQKRHSAESTPQVMKDMKIIGLEARYALLFSNANNEHVKKWCKMMTISKVMTKNILNIHNIVKIVHNLQNQNLEHRTQMNKIMLKHLILDDDIQFIQNIHQYSSAANIDNTRYCDISKNQVYFLIKYYLFKNIHDKHECTLQVLHLLVLYDLIDTQDLIEIKELLTQDNLFPISSKSLMNRGFKGKALGDVIKRLYNLWIMSSFKLSQNELMSYL